MSFPTLSFEKSLWHKGFIVIGIDEVGRGCFAGPLLLAGVIFKPTASKYNTELLESLGINDSKKLSSLKRKGLNKIIKKTALSYSYATISPAKIDKLGLTHSTEIATRKIVKDLINKVSGFGFRILNFYLLIDAFSVKWIKGIGLKNQKGIIHGDQKCLSIAAASIIAKVKRDTLMEKLSSKYPEYGLAQNKGYGTKKHRDAISQYGTCKIHRKSFLKIKNI